MWPAMRPALPRWFRRAADLVRLLAVVLALAGQVAAGARAEGDDTDAPRRALERAMVFCQSGQANHPHDAPAPRHRHGCATMLQASARVWQPAVAADVPVLPAPNAGHFMRGATLKQARAPPARATEAAYPRGPPGLA